MSFQDKVSNSAVIYYFIAFISGAGSTLAFTEYYNNVTKTIDFVKKEKYEQLEQKYLKLVKATSPIVLHPIFLIEDKPTPFLNGQLVLNIASIDPISDRVKLQIKMSDNTYETLDIKQGNRNTFDYEESTYIVDILEVIINEEFHGEAKVMVTRKVG